MKRHAFLMAAVAFCAAIVSCQKEEPLKDITPTLDSQNISIHSGETVKVNFSLNDVRGFSINETIEYAAFGSYNVAVGFKDDYSGGTVEIAAPDIILDNTPFDINLTFTDSQNDRVSSSKITVNPILVNGYVELEEGANSYIVAPGAVAAFPTSLGNSGESAMSEDIILQWQDTPGLFVDMIQVGLDKAIVRFADGKEGNALLSGLDAKGNVVWSWHFWVVKDTPKDVTVGGVSFMDRNIGALNLDEKSELSVGVTYQYGRKDPFPSIKFGEYALRTIYDANGEEAEIAIVKNEEENNLANAIANPSTFYNNVYVSGAKHGYSWLTTDATTFDPEVFKSLWENDGKKSMYDPCPAGYKVAPLSAWEGVKAATDIVEIWDDDYVTFDDSAIGTNEKYAEGNRKKVQFRGASFDGLRLTITGEINSNSDKFSFANCIGKPLPTAEVWASNIDPDFASKLNASYFRGTAVKLNTSGNGNYEDISAVKMNALSTAGKYNLNYALPVRCVRE